MHDKLMQARPQAFVKRVRASMDLLARRSTSPEDIAQAIPTAGRLPEQASEPAMGHLRSGGCAHLMPGTANSDTGLVVEFSQSGMAISSRGQDAVTRQGPEAANRVIDAADDAGASPC